MGQSRPKNRLLDVREHKPTIDPFFSHARQSSTVFPGAVEVQGKMSRPTALERVRQTQLLLRSEGYAGVAVRLLDHVSRRVSPL